MSVLSQKRGLAALILLTVALLQACSLNSGAPTMSALQSLQNAATAAALAQTQAAMNGALPVQAGNAPAAAPQNPGPVQPPPQGQLPLAPSGGGSGTSGGPQVSPVGSNSFCRSGPDKSFKDTSFVLVGQSAQIIGRNSAGTWWLVNDPQNRGAMCWVANVGVSLSGNVAGVPIVNSSSAGISVFVQDPVISGVICNAGQSLQFQGSINTSDAATVTYRWELGGDMTQITQPQTLTFGSGGGALQVPSSDPIKLNCGQYSITLHVLSPRDTSATKNFSVQEPTPGTVTNPAVSVIMPTNVVCGDATSTDPTNFHGSITLDAPARVSYQWVLGSATGSEILDDESLFFGAGTSSVQDPGPKQLDCGTYTVRIHVSGPNDISSTSEVFDIVAAP